MKSGCHSQFDDLVLPPPASEPRHHRAIFLSDLHLGARACRADKIADFLSHNSADTLYLVGDIFDLWHHNPSDWSPDHDRVVQMILRRARADTRVVYLIGNHDEVLHRTFARLFDEVELAEQVLHRTADGRSLLVMHGDVCDAAWQQWRLATRLGSRFEDTLRIVDRWVKSLRKRLNDDRKSGIETFIDHCNRLLRLGNAYESRLTSMARALGQDGVICGHFHQAALHESDGLVYGNCGDWVASMTAITEDAAGNLTLTGWSEGWAMVPLAPAQPQAAAQAPAVVR
ncbi:MAG: UDP-2,3-diacylglucosamine diphosphatase [Rhodobacteraceae bacterium]|nr:UDP-2,3-diacylglucosamine diphosphatase [Paracoccaceae bacterium]